MRQGERTDLAADGGKVSQEGAADLLGVSKGTVQRCKVRDFKFSEVRKFASPLDHHPLRAEHQERDEQRHGGHIARDVPRGVVHALNPLRRRMTIAHRPAHGAQNVILVGLEPSTFADEIVKVDVDLAALAAAADSFRHACFGRIISPWWTKAAMVRGTDQLPMSNAGSPARAVAEAPVATPAAAAGAAGPRVGAKRRRRSPAPRRR
jgi:hypothetical protein